MVLCNEANKILFCYRHRWATKKSSLPICLRNREQLTTFTEGALSVETTHLITLFYSNRYVRREHGRPVARHYVIVNVTDSDITCSLKFYVPTVDWHDTQQSISQELTMHSSVSRWRVSDPSYESSELVIFAIPKTRHRFSKNHGDLEALLWYRLQNIVAYWYMAVSETESKDISRYSTDFNHVDYSCSTGKLM